MGGPESSVYAEMPVYGRAGFLAGEAGRGLLDADQRDRQRRQAEAAFARGETITRDGPYAHRPPSNWGYYVGGSGDAPQAFGDEDITMTGLAHRSQGQPFAGVGQDRQGQGLPPQPECRCKSLTVHRLAAVLGFCAGEYDGAGCDVSGWWEGGGPVTVLAVVLVAGLVLTVCVYAAQASKRRRSR